MPELNYENAVSEESSRLVQSGFSYVDKTKLALLVTVPMLFAVPQVMDAMFISNFPEGFKRHRIDPNSHYRLPAKYVKEHSCDEANIKEIRKIIARMKLGDNWPAKFKALDVYAQVLSGSPVTMVEKKGHEYAYRVKKDYNGDGYFINTAFLNLLKDIDPNGEMGDFLLGNQDWFNMTIREAERRYGSIKGACNRNNGLSKMLFGSAVAFFLAGIVARASARKKEGALKMLGLWVVASVLAWEAVTKSSSSKNIENLFENVAKSLVFEQGSTFGGVYTLELQYDQYLKQQNKFKSGDPNKRKADDEARKIIIAAAKNMSAYAEGSPLARSAKKDSLSSETSVSSSDKSITKKKGKEQKPTLVNAHRSQTAVTRSVNEKKDLRVDKPPR